MNRLFSAQETAQRLGVSLWTIYRWARSGRMASIQLGRRRLFSQEDLQALISQARTTTSVSSAARKTAS
jgi:excisionase family DNA binding protein